MMENEFILLLIYSRRARALQAMVRWSRCIDTLLSKPSVKGQLYSLVFHYLLVIYSSYTTRKAKLTVSLRSNCFYCLWQ